MKIIFKDKTEIENSSDIHNFSMTATKTDLIKLLIKFDSLEYATIEDSGITITGAKVMNYVILPLDDGKYRIAFNIHIPENINVDGLLSENKKLKNELSNKESEIQQRVSEEISKLTEELNKEHQNELEEMNEQKLNNKKIKEYLETLIISHESDHKERVAIIEAITELYEYIMTQK